MSSNQYYDEYDDGMMVQDGVSQHVRGGLVDISGYRPSSRAVMQVARDFEKTYVDLNHALIQLDATHNLARRAKLCVASTHAFADQLSALVPSAQGTLGQILEVQAEETVDILRNWRRKRRHE